MTTIESEATTRAVVKHMHAIFSKSNSLFGTPLRGCLIDPYPSIDSLASYMKKVAQEIEEANEEALANRGE